MPFINPSHSIRTLLAVLVLALCVFPSLVWGEEEEDTIGLFSAWQDISSTASRAPKPLSQTAENVTVVTAKDIEALNAHTLADVLDTIPGIQLQHNGGPGITTYTQIQSSEFTQILVIVDGISITNLAGNYSHVNLIPARIIERIEIVKGAASTSWGQALGGVINVITKSPDKGRSIGGSVSASIGERTTTDSGVELTGTSGRLGYYLSGGFLGSNGLLPGTEIASNNAYGKLTYDLPDRGQLFAFFNYNRTGMGDLIITDIDLKERANQRLLRTSIGLRQPMGKNLELEVIGRHSFLRNEVSWYNISDGAPWSLQPDLPTGLSKDSVTGASAKLIWRGENNLLVAGGDYDHVELSSNTPDNSTLNPYSRILERWDTYLNDTITLGPVSLTPGMRLDHTHTNGDQFSYSLGVTWQATGDTLLRAYTGRGYGIPPVDANSWPSIRIWASQVGVESTAVPYVWLKGSLFRNQIWNSPAFDSDGNPITEQHIALGTELEVRTTPIWHTSLGAGYTFTDTTRTNDGSQVNELPRHTVKLALRYDDQTYRGVLTGQHIYWNSRPDQMGRYGGLIWDLHLGATLLKRENSSLELFFSGHNIFNGVQFDNSLIPNTGRWFDGGLRVRF